MPTNEAIAPTNSQPIKSAFMSAMGASQFPQKFFHWLLSRFSRAKSSGTGLGLAITKRIVNAHGGELFIQSEVVGGTRVSVKLPVVN